MLFTKQQAQVNAANFILVKVMLALSSISISATVSLGISQLCLILALAISFDCYFHWKAISATGSRTICACVCASHTLALASVGDVEENLYYALSHQNIF